MIKRQKVRTFEVKLFCDYCKADMEWTGDTLDHEPKYPHRCTNKKCTNVHVFELGGPSYFINVNMDKVYPCLEYGEHWGVEF